MTVAASRGLATGIGSAFATAPNTPVPKASGSASALATQAAPFPDLFGALVDAETNDQPSSPYGAATASKATAARGAGAPGKVAGARNRITSGATIADPGQNPAVPDPVITRPQYPSLPQDGMLSATSASGNPSSATGDTGGNSGAGKTAALARDDGKAASVQSDPSQPAGTSGGAAKLGQTLAEPWGPAGDERPSNPIPETTAEAAIQSADGAQETGCSASTATAQALEATGPLAAAGADRSASESAGARAARREAAAGAPSSQASASSPPIAAATPVNARICGAGWQATVPDQNIAETRPRAAHPMAAAQATYTAAAQAADDATSLYALPVASSKGSRDRETSDQSDATAAGGDGSPDGDSLAEQGLLAFQALLVPAPASDPPRAGQGARKPGDDASGQQPSLTPSGGLNGGRSGSRSALEADPSLAGAVRPGRQRVPGRAGSTGFLHGRTGPVGRSRSDGAVRREPQPRRFAGAGRPFRLGRGPAGSQARGERRRA